MGQATEQAGIRLDAQAYAAFRALVYEHAGIAIRDGKESLVAARVTKRMRALRLADVGDYLAHIRADTSGDEMITLLDAISTNTTSFFREAAAFAAMSERLDRWLAAGQRKIRIWCAAASTGEEPYTLAMVLGEALRKARLDFRQVDVAILATDISTRVIEIARTGSYAERIMAGVPAELRQRYFDQRGEVWQAKSELRQLITFNRLNLAKPPFPMKGPLDLVFCRNVMIYFDNPVRERLVNDAYRLLRSDGLLLTGSAESLTGLKHAFRTLRPSTYLKA